MSLEILGCPACAGTAIQAVNDENFDIAVSMGPQPNGHGYSFNGAGNTSMLTDIASRVSMGPQPNGHGYRGA
jgi:hypothetical protein